MANWDRLEDALGKLGLGDTVIEAGGAERLVEGTEQFDVWRLSGAWPASEVEGTFYTLVKNKALLDQYHIIFVGCDSDVAGVLDLDPQAKQNLRDWVAAGGRFYAADWSADWITKAFGQYQDIYDPNDVASYDSLGLIEDDDLLAWLEALPEGLRDVNPATQAAGGSGGHPTVSQLPYVMTVDHFTAIEQTYPVLVDDGNGGQVDVGHKAWISGPGHPAESSFPQHPLTVTGQYGCGKILFTSYHMAEYQGGYVGLTPQELVLMYLILEIGVCQVPTPPPPPVG
jgi:hypothetical protein